MVVESVIDVLCELNDIGFGKVRDEPVLVALPERRIALPDGRNIALGDHGIGTGIGSELLFPEVENGATETLFDLLSALGDASELKGTGSLSPKGQWSGRVPMHPALRRALTLCSAFDPVTQEWSMSELNAAFLNDWFDLANFIVGADNSETSDVSQRRVAKAQADKRMVVEAGPGSGKTHVACERVISLVRDEGLAPSKILLLSFTRIAVAELRARIAARLSDLPNTAAFQIRTFDSFASRLLSVSSNGVSGGFNANVRTANRLLRSGDPLVADFIGRFEHVVIDEAQDLVGDRKALCEALVDLLHQDCGVTVFGDFAQAIYGYQRRDPAETTFLTDIAGRDGFSSDKLERDHRTKTEALRKMFSSVRETLRDDPEGSPDSYFSTRDQIFDAALEKDISKFATHPSTTRGLILTRSRKSLFTVAEAMRAEGRRFRLRLPHRPLRIDPWIGAILGGLAASEQISRETFGTLHDALYPVAPLGVDECWKILLDLDGSGRDTITIGDVADSLDDPPLELLCDHEGSGGPLLSTIHAIKGHESPCVMLLLTRAPKGDHVDWAEEARTLFVGATRASTELRTGWVNSMKFYSKGNPGRYWLARSDHRLIEIGLESDLIDWQDFILTGNITDRRESIAAIWKAATGEVQVEAVPDATGKLCVRETDSDASPLACLSSSFLEALQSIRQAKPDEPPPTLISGISVVGATTIVVPGNAGDARSLALMPLLGGFARVAR